MNIIKMSTYAHDNAVRCAIALASPMILKLAGVSMRDKSVPLDYRSLFPTYIFDGVDYNIMSPAFVYTDARLQGKKRVYVNSNGYRMFYLQHKVLLKYRRSVEKTFGVADAAEFEKIIDKLANRWVVMSFRESESMPKTCAEFAERMALIETEPRKKNHPPTNPCGFKFVDLVTDTPMEGKVKQINVLDPMSVGVTLSNYTMSV